MSAFSAVFFVVLCTGCSDAPQQSGTTIADSSGIMIVESASGTWTEADAWRLSAQPSLTIGLIDGPPEYQLHRVVGSSRMADGRIVVGNAGTDELRFYGPDGAHLESVGGRGGGPGEFQRLRSIRLITGDSVLVYDSSNRRVSIFDPWGAFVRSYEIAPFTGQPAFVHHVLPFPDGSVLAGAFRFRSSRVRVETGLSRDTSTLVHCDAEGQLIASIGQFPAMEWYTGPEIPRMEVLFARGTDFAVHGEHFFVGDNASYRIAEYRRDGTLVRIIRRSLDAVPVTAGDIDLERQAWLDNLAEEEQWMADVPAPPTMPAYSAVRVDTDGNLWVERYQPHGEDVANWTVFNREGSMLGTVDVPAKFDVHQIGADYVLGSWHDEMNVEHVRLFELAKP